MVTLEIGFTPPSTKCLLFSVVCPYCCLFNYFVGLIQSSLCYLFPVSLLSYLFFSNTLTVFLYYFKKCLLALWMGLCSCCPIPSVPLLAVYNSALTSSLLKYSKLVKSKKLGPSYFSFVYVQICTCTWPSIFPHIYQIFLKFLKDIYFLRYFF